MKPSLQVYAMVVVYVLIIDCQTNGYSSYGCFTLQVGPQFHETAWLCSWEMVEINCSKLFIPVLTEEGICFSFNVLHAMEMYRDTV